MVTVFEAHVESAMWQAAIRAPDHATPKTRGVFVLTLAADAVARFGYSVAEARKHARYWMADLEEACGPWGDPDFDWTAGAAREWNDESLGSDEDAS